MQAHKLVQQARGHPPPARRPRGRHPIAAGSGRSPSEAVPRFTGAAEGLVDLLPDDDIGHAELVLQRHEDHAPSPCRDAGGRAPAPPRRPAPPPAAGAAGDAADSRRFSAKREGGIIGPSMRTEIEHVRPPRKPRCAAGHHSPQEPKSGLEHATNPVLTYSPGLVRSHEERQNMAKITYIEHNGHRTCRGCPHRPDRDGRRARQTTFRGIGGRLRRRLRLFHLPCLRASRLGPETARDRSDGRGHAGIRLSNPTRSGRA